MIPVHLHLSGFLSYHDPVDLDFSTFDVACVSGSNGAGKSSLLDAMTWALFGQARRKDDTIINSNSKMAEVVFEIDYENAVYRVQRIKARDKATVLEFAVQTNDGGWRTLTERSVKETELRIQQILRMDYDTFINASFFLQGKADLFAQQRPGDRKRILSSILGLEVWESYKIAAAERRKRQESEAAGLDSLLEEITAELNQEEARKERLRAIEEQLEQLQAVRQAKETSMDALRRLASSLAEQRRLLEVLQGQLESSRRRQDEREAHLQARRQERQGYLEQLAGEEEVKAAYARWQEARKSLERWDALAVNFRQHEQERAAPLMAIESERSRLEQERQTLLAQEKAVNESSGRLPVLVSQLEENRAEMARLVGVLNTRPALEAEQRTAIEDQTNAQAENRRLRELMKDLKERIDHLKQVHGVDCPLCGQPLSPEDRDRLVADLEREGREMGDRFRANNDLVKELESRRKEIDRKLAEFPPMENDLRKLQRLVDQLEDQQTQVRAAQQSWQAGGAVRLNTITKMLAENSYAQEARAELARVDEALKALGYDATAHDAVRREEQSGRSTEEALRQLEAARAALAPLEREVARLEEQCWAGAAEVTAQAASVAQAEEKYQADAAALPDMKLAEQELFSLQEQENRTRMQVGGARQAVAVLDTQRKRHADLTAKRAGLSRKIGQLKHLERAFGKDGVPALLIEQALPDIEEQANEILDRLSGGKMSVRFATQKDYKDKNRDDKKETLDIVITDSSGPREYELFSGGEAFRVNFAIRLALSRFLAQRAGARLQTLVIDEGFGSQDAEGRQRLIEAINMVRPDFAKILAITHMDELKEFFPVRVEVEKTNSGSQVRVVA